MDSVTCGDLTYYRDGKASVPVISFHDQSGAVHFVEIDHPERGETIVDFDYLDRLKAAKTREEYLEIARQRHGRYWFIVERFYQHSAQALPSRYEAVC